jgi:hypothetical protein
MSVIYGPTDDSDSRATLERTLDRGVTPPDTSTTKGAGHNERLLAGGRPRRHGLTGPVRRHARWIRVHAQCRPSPNKRRERR